ncbi:hypothetical protein [Parahaliea mediterranea]|uniref:hypothetical protein n=1 Tax=Parahaliea mediterranea TaxID=651086 RepID=UPI00187EC0A8|nr:hypothetical protein [Parahaliea mediterranea]
MTEVFVIRNQLGHFWGKSKAWVDGRDPRAVLRVKHQDEGINTLFELSAKDVELRGEVVPAELGPKGEPVLQVSDIPLPVAPEAEAASDAAPESAPPAGGEQAPVPSVADADAEADGEAGAEAEAQPGPGEPRPNA